LYGAPPWGVVGDVPYAGGYNSAPIVTGSSASSFFDTGRKRWRLPIRTWKKSATRVSEGEHRLAALEWSIEAAERQGFSTALLLEALEILRRSVDLVRQHQALIERVLGEPNLK
jgi:hypothetical protein